MRQALLPTMGLIKNSKHPQMLGIPFPWPITRPASSFATYVVSL
jgi:hypothetical protein